jgi:hypothetical protein
MKSCGDDRARVPTSDLAGSNLRVHGSRVPCYLLGYFNVPFEVELRTESLC